jgi:GNAT superfamily N-acetyltransferase
MNPPLDSPRNQEAQTPVEIELVSPLTEAVLSPIKALAHQVFEDSRQDTSRDRLDYTVMFVISTDKVLEGALRNYPRDSFVATAKLDGTLAGYAVMVIGGQNKVIDSFVGVNWLFLRRGIATKLMRAAHEELKRRGISEYTADIWEGSKKLYEKEQAAGQLTITDVPGNPKQIIVKLNRP